MSDDLTPAYFTARELQTVRNCCRDADATDPFKAFLAALARAERAEPKPAPAPAPKVVVGGLPLPKRNV